MFNAEESLQHIKEMRFSVIMMKDGKSEEGLPPLDLDEEHKNQLHIIKDTQKEINA